MAGLTRGQQRIVTDEQLIECFGSFIAMANHYSPSNPAAAYVIEELEINPFAFREFLMVPLDGMCRFSLPAEAATRRGRSPRSTVCCTPRPSAWWAPRPRA